MKKLKIIFSSITFSAFSLLLTSCDTEEIADRVETIVNNMLPNLYITLVQLALFILTAVVFVLIAYKPLKKKLKQRSDYIESNIKESEDKKVEAQKLVDEANQNLLDSQKKGVEIVQHAQATAERKNQIAIEELKAQVEIQKIHAHKDIEAERNKMIKEAKTELVEIAISTSKEILKREVKKEDSDKYIDEFIDEFSKNNWK